MSDTGEQPALQELSHDTLSRMFLSVTDRCGANVAYRHFVGSSDSLVDVTYEDLYQLVLAASGGLRKLGVGAGDRVAIFSDNCLQWVVSDFACICSAVLDVPIYGTLTAGQVAFILKNSGSRLVFVSTSEQAEKAFTEGIYFDGSSIEGFVRIQESDMRLVPDASTYAELPWLKDENGRGTARVISDVRRIDNTSFEGDPRNTLQTSLEKANKMGFEVNVGTEPEFFILKMHDNNPTTEPHDVGGYFDITPADQASQIRRKMVYSLQQLGFEIEASHHEVAEGQHEIDWKYAPALKTADNVVTFKAAVRAVAQQNGVYATFMPKPISGINGSGMHTHMSLFKNGKNAFFDQSLLNFKIR